MPLLEVNCSSVPDNIEFEQIKTEPIEHICYDYSQQNNLINDESYIVNSNVPATYATANENDIINTPMVNIILYIDFEKKKQS
jgi:hypothetical protein